MGRSPGQGSPSAKNACVFECESVLSLSRLCWCSRHLLSRDAKCNEKSDTDCWGKQAGKAHLCVVLVESLPATQADPVLGRVGLRLNGFVEEARFVHPTAALLLDAPVLSGVQWV